MKERKVDIISLKFWSNSGFSEFRYFLITCKTPLYERASKKKSFLWSKDPREIWTARVGVFECREKKNSQLVQKRTDSKRFFGELWKCVRVR